MLMYMCVCIIGLNCTLRWCLIVGGVAHGYPRRRESLAKIHSMTVEAPITKVYTLSSRCLYPSSHMLLTRSTIYLVHSLNLFVVYSQVINIINAAQENSPITVVQALDKVLEILRTSQLYSPHFVQPMKEGDTMTSDLVGGLVSVSSLATKTNCH